MKSHARVVIIGGGAVGCSALYHLGKLGWTDTLLIERDELTSGSTWHAAGNCPNFSTSWNVLKFQRHSTKLYAKLGEEVDYPMNYHVTGSIRLAHTKARMEEYAHVRGMARAQGLDFELLSPADIKKRYPFIELHDLEGGLWDPFDGDIDPSQLTQAYAKGARDMGAEIVRFTRVTGLERTKAGEWLVKTDKGDVTCEYRGQRRRLSRRRDHGHGRAIHADRVHVSSVLGDRTGRGTGGPQGEAAAAARSRYQLLSAAGAQRPAARAL